MTTRTVVTSSSSSSGIGLGGLLGITFIILKLTKVITWSWVWVLAPFWISAALFVLIFLLCLLAIALIER